MLILNVLFVIAIVLLTIGGLYGHEIVSFVESLSRDKRTWIFTRYGGGGSLTSPGPMTEKEAIRWIAANNCEVGHVDREHAFIFYKPRGN